ncbi:MAG TPA: hypothetical protein VG324_26015 [Blastocatellia bacterium]|nr:hypothetical protein [Blastocatellia bacterium]
MSDKFVQVPPGHKVVVIHPSPKAQIGLTESKLVILDFGTSGDWQTMLADIEAGLSSGTFPSTVTILQLPMIERLDAAGELSAFIARWQSARQSGWNAVWVLPNEASTRNDVVDLLKNAGFGAHGSAEDGACFVEVHKPDGTITIGMPGPSL